MIAAISEYVGRIDPVIGGTELLQNIILYPAKLPEALMHLYRTPERIAFGLLLLFFFLNDI